MRILKIVFVIIAAVIIGVILGKSIAFAINTHDAEKINYTKGKFDCDNRPWTDRFFLHLESMDAGSGKIVTVWRCLNPVDLVGISNSGNNNRMLFIESVESGELYKVPYDNCSVGYHLNIFTGDIYRKVSCK